MKTKIEVTKYGYLSYIEFPRFVRLHGRVKYRDYGVIPYENIGFNFKNVRYGQELGGELIVRVRDFA